jgi:nickel-type superoxide dismutase maturation protease
VRPYRRSSAVAAGVAAAGALAAAAVLARRRLGRVTVAGTSMCPALEPGDRLLLVRRRRYRPGVVVAVADPRDPRRLLVKRVVAVAPGGALVVTGDDPASSTDSRAFGPVPPALVRGQAVRRYAPPGRAGRVPRAAGPPSLPSSAWTGTASSACSPPSAT